MLFLEAFAPFNRATYSLCEGRTCIHSVNIPYWSAQCSHRQAIQYLLTRQRDHERSVDVYV